METGQYRTKRLTITKSYIAHRSKRIAVSEIAEVNQPKNSPVAIVTGLFLLVGTFALFNGNVFFLMFSGLLFIGGLLPPPVINITTSSGTSHRLNFGKERSPQRAIRTIKANVQEFQDKSSRARTYTIATSSSNYPLNPEEHVRQYVLQLLAIKFGFAKSDTVSEFPIKLGSSQKRADVVVFLPGKPHIQSNIYIIIECKRMDRRDDSAAQDQLESYLSACLNARYGVVATHRWRVTEKINNGGAWGYQSIPALVDVNGAFQRIDYNPVQPVHSQGVLDVDQFLDDLAPLEPGSGIPQIFRGTLKYALAAGAVIAVIFVVANATQPSSSVLPTLAALRSRTPAPINQQAVNDMASTILPTETAPRFRTFTPSLTFNRQTVVSTNAVPGVMEAESTASPDESSELLQPTITSVPVLATLAPATLVATVAPTDPPTTARFGVIQTTLNVNLRQSASTRAGVITVMSPGTRIEIIGENEDGSWLQVRLSSGEVGWVATRLVRME